MGKKLSSKEIIGRIQSVYCKNFVSYNEITYHPGEHLNVLTGPNGSGKSTIVSAIILGFGGDPSLLDRSSSIKDYVRSGENKGEVIVKVYGKNKDTIEAFRRTINTQGESHFFVNDESMSKKKFLAAVASFNVQVGNLCQFLPQDRVQDFSKMDPQELLLNTMSSVCDDKLMKSFLDMKEHRKEQLCIHADREKDIGTLQRETKRLEQLKTTVDQYKEREEFVQKLNILYVKKLWMDKQIGENKVVKFKEQLKTATADHKIANEKYKQEKEAHDSIMKINSQLQRNQIQKTNLLKVTMESKNNLDSELAILKRKLYESKSEFKRKIEHATSYAKDLDSKEALLSTVKHDMDMNKKTKLEVTSKLEELKGQMNKTRQQTLHFYNRRTDLDTHINDKYIPEIAAIRHSLGRLQNLKKQKIEELHLKNPELLKSMNWIAQNRHMFKGIVYDPVLFELNVENKNGATYLENVIRYRDLCAFACENKDDMSKLIEELCVQQRSSVNVFYCPPAESCHYKPTVPIEDLRGIGFYTYLVDLVSGPAPILNKLCAMYQIHNIPIGSAEVGNNAHRIPTSIRHYFGGNKKFSVTISRYRPESMLTENHVHCRNQFVVSDLEQIKSLEIRLGEASAKLDRARNELSNIDNELKRLEIISSELNEERKTNEHKCAYWVRLEEDVARREKEIQAIKRSIVPIDTLNEEFNRIVVPTVNKIFELESTQCNEFEKLCGLLRDSKIATSMESVHKSANESHKDNLNESETQQKNAAAKVNELSGAIQNQMKEIDDKVLEVKRLSKGFLPTDAEFPYKMDFDDMTKCNIGEINEKIHDCRARLDCLKNVDTEAIDNFYRRQIETEKLKTTVETKADREKVIEAEIGTLYDEWEPRLSSLIATISTKFSEFMESIEYVGEVVLSKKDTFDFDSYGIQIMVQYRKDAKLQSLDKFVQSGGERAVAIAVYSLSLQHITQVPFRCVDEINQGMDAKNERKIFNLLLTEATKHGSAQYIFVTPKLLPDLNYNEHLCVSIVHNSKTVAHGAQFPLI